MNRIKKAICGGMVGLAGIVGGSGCTTEGNAFGQALVQSAIVTGVTSGVDAAVRNEIEGPRGTTIVNNNGYQAPQEQYVEVQQNPHPKHNKLEDLDYVDYMDGNQENVIFGKIIEKGKTYLIIQSGDKKISVDYSQIKYLNDKNN